MKEFMLLTAGIVIGGLLVKKIGDIKALKDENTVLKAKLNPASGAA